jgi:hypothetical protein
MLEANTMATPRELISSTLERWEELILLRGQIEDYILFSAAKIISFGVGIGIGYWIWGTIE